MWEISPNISGPDLWIQPSARWGSPKSKATLARLAHSSPACLSHIHGQEHNVKGHTCMFVKTPKPCQKTSEKTLVTHIDSIIFYIVSWVSWVSCAYDVHCPSAPSETSHPTMPPLSHGSCQSWQRRRRRHRRQAPRAIRAQGSAEQRGAQGSWPRRGRGKSKKTRGRNREYNWYITGI